MAVLLGMWPKIHIWWSVSEDGPKTYHEFQSLAGKHIGAKEATLDQDKGKVNPNRSCHPKDKKMDKKSMPKCKKEKEDTD